MEIIKSYANETERHCKLFKQIFQDLAVIYKDMGRNPEPGSLIQQTREWEYPYALTMSEPKNGDKVLDLGGGASPMPMYLAQMGCRVTVLDIDSYDGNPNYNLDKLWGYHPMYRSKNLKYVKADMVKARIPPVYNKIYCIGVLEHMSERERMLMFAKIPLILAPGGIAVITWDTPITERVDRLLYHCDVDSLVIRKEG